MNTLTSSDFVFYIALYLKCGKQNCQKFQTINEIINYCFLSAQFYQRVSVNRKLCTYALHQCNL
ncbi:hypothetical protein T01_11562 [Trichinella spiralis]|uniref:Uncharacterized protein n=1 Tax=Trichinella spiralis TaxID=6334 RepID=A0A0V1BXU7_TRISP|nr:hypothetical protein T01_11562 [Trichinella spiralis]